MLYDPIILILEKLFGEGYDPMQVLVFLVIILIAAKLLFRKKRK
jgi:hypothetical protein